MESCISTSLSASLRGALYEMLLWMKTEVVALIMALVALLMAVAYRAVPLVHRSNMKRPSLPPGPRPWPIVGNLLQVGPVPHFGMTKLNQKYGPLIFLKLGVVSAVVTDEPAYVAEFLRKQDHVFASRPHNIASEHFTYGGKDIAFAPFGSHWRSMRRLCLFQLLTPKCIEYFRHSRLEEVSCMASEVLELSRSGTVINLRNTFGGLSSNTLTRMVLGKRHFGAGDAGPAEAAEHKALIYAAFALINAFNIGDYLPFLRPLDLHGQERAMRRIMARVDEIYGAIIEEYSSRAAAASSAAASGGKCAEIGSFMDQLLSLSLPQNTIKAILIDLIAAGTDTSSITSEWAMAELMHHPDIMKKVRDEIDAKVGKDRVVDDRDVANLQHLKAAVKEIFRLHPVGAFLIPHVSLQDTTVAGYYIPKGTRVLINTYSLGRNPKVWDRPTEFLPERFFCDNVELNDPEMRIVPFGAGRRGCPGATLGTNVVLLGLARLIQLFDWELAESSKELKEAYGLMVLENPLEAYATPRLAPHLYH